jgi:hypothetical protein
VLQQIRAAGSLHHQSAIEPAQEINHPEAERIDGAQIQGDSVAAVRFQAAAYRQGSHGETRVIQVRVAFTASKTAGLGLLADQKFPMSRKSVWRDLTEASGNSVG